MCIPAVVEDNEPSSGYLVKQSCHDSGIDIRDPPVLAVPRKTVYSDADILLSESDFLPPVPVLPLSSEHLTETVQLRKKKTTSVSFSLEDSKEHDTASGVEVPKVDDQAEKQAQETKKNKVSKMYNVQQLFPTFLLVQTTYFVKKNLCGLLMIINTPIYVCT